MSATTGNSSAITKSRFKAGDGGDREEVRRDVARPLRLSDPRNQCWPGGVPFEFTNNIIQILQKQNEILILYNGDHQIRHVRLNQPHPARVTPSWYGDSVGHYEGDTLVVERWA